MSLQKMNKGRLMQVLIAPVRSEKATMAAENNQIMFKVLQDATKTEIKAAVELFYEVEVDSVRVLNRKGKTKRFGRSMGRRNHVRYAFVCLKEGQDINAVQEGA